MKIIAIDWSGATLNSRNRIWLAECDGPGHLLRLECGRDRREIADHLQSLPPGPAVIGLDFAFSFPAWYLDALGFRNAPNLWEYVGTHGESWLAACEPPFWGRPGHKRPVSAHAAFRRTDVCVPKTSGIAPKSIFQIGGAGAVGTGSIRGMPLLLELHRRGARIWPFTEGGYPVVVEIYPRLLTGPVRKSRSVARADFVAERYPTLDSAYARTAAESEDAFDAMVSSLVMSEYADELIGLPEEPDGQLMMEGRIWHPRWRYDVISGT